jgi:hypothetical protein
MPAKEECHKRHAYRSSSKRLIIVRIGSENGFLSEDLLTYKADIASGDNHREVNSMNFIEIYM